MRGAIGRFTLISCVIISLFFILNSSCLPIYSSQDISDRDTKPWSMIHHDPRHTSRSSYNCTDLGSSRKKVYSMDGQGLTSAIIGEKGTLYVGSGSGDNRLYAISKDGDLKWTFKGNDWLEGTPAIDEDGTIYTGSISGTLYALNPDGSLEWRYDTDQYDISSPVIGTDGIVYFGTEESTLWAVYPNGTLKWKYKCGNFSHVPSTPAIDENNTIYFTCYSEGLYALTSDGKLKWKFNPDENLKGNSPVIDDDGTLYVTSSRTHSGIGYLYAVDKDGQERWNFTMPGFYFTSNYHKTIALGRDEQLFIGSDNMHPWVPKGKLISLDKEGELLWEKDFKDPVSNLIVDNKNTLYFTSGHKFYSYSEDGEENKVIDIGDSSISCPTISNDGDIYLTLHNGDIITFTDDDIWLYTVPIGVLIISITAVTYNIRRKKE